MNYPKTILHCLFLLVPVLLFAGNCASWAESQSQPPDNLVPLYVKLPPPPFGSALESISTNEHLAPLSQNRRPQITVPPGVTNLALKATITCSDRSVIRGDLQQLLREIQDPNQSSVVLRPGLQWIQLDLGRTSSLYAIVVWHSIWPPNIFHDVVIQIADDEKFTTNVRTLFNNDYDNTSGLGSGRDMEYYESFEGKLVSLPGLSARHVRLYSAGSVKTKGNAYLRIDVYGIPQER